MKKFDFLILLCYNVFCIKKGFNILRIIAGIAKKRQLKAPRGLQVRPTSDRVKEALFNILGSSISGSSFLDLFAGTGNVGIEALSRGADRAVFVEKDIKNIRIIKENLNITGLEVNARLLCLNVNKAIALLGQEGQVYDLIFIDPPYLKDLVSSTLNDIIKNGLLKPGGTIIVESSKKDPMPRDAAASLRLLRQEKYGDTLLSFYNYQ
ncbi:16S rRNA (guanine(966)-N(2))-methyltransferase RsmD [Pelotomaculum isophthalicicum]|uniref:16S rRNA (guanine(966)-N(2))-methyltransferase RsmD n=1 Tax=Pelotomaculum isophthalicicum TaxID=342448 RepID=UPI002406B806|nr:16S rRNA (guanine(966)-N(2))-methyltransferase RsmD [Pelotomaculum isophthalicicum]